MDAGEVWMPSPSIGVNSSGWLCTLAPREWCPTYGDDGGGYAGILAVKISEGGWNKSWSSLDQ
jgi:hypothetical protein